MLLPCALQGKGTPRDLNEDSVELKSRQDITRLSTILWPNQTHLVLFLSAPNTPNNDSCFAASGMPVINPHLVLNTGARGGPQSLCYLLSLQRGPFVQSLTQVHQKTDVAWCALDYRESEKATG